MCACEANAPLLAELRNFDEECLRTGKVKLRYVRRNVDALASAPLEPKSWVVESHLVDEMACVVCFGSRVLVRLI